MNKKQLIIIILLVISVTLSMAEKRIESVHFNGSDAVGTFKAGLVIGYPTGASLGLRLSDIFEINALIGTNYSGFTVGVAPMFTLIDFKISEQQLPLSLGPAVNLNIRAYGFVDLDVQAMLRLEYSFPKIPLNLFVEGGMGININFYSSVFPGLEAYYSPVAFTGSIALGARYIF